MDSIAEHRPCDVDSDSAVAVVSIVAATLAPPDMHAPASAVKPARKIASAVKRFAFYQWPFSEWDIAILSRLESALRLDHLLG